MTTKNKSNFRDMIGQDTKEQKQRGSQYGYLRIPHGVTVFKEEAETKVWLDILPYRVSDPKHPDRNEEYGKAIVGGLWYKRPFFIHRNVGVGNESVVCPSTIGKPCPICSYRAKRIKEEAPKDEIKALKPSERVLYVVVPKNHKDFEETPHIWDISFHNFQKMLNKELEENDNCLAFPDLEEGKTLRIRFSEVTLGSNTFAQTSRIDFDDRDAPYDENVVDDAVPCLDTMFILLSYKELEAKFFELDDVEATDAEQAGPDAGETAKHPDAGGDKKEQEHKGSAGTGSTKKTFGKKAGAAPQKQDDAGPEDDDVCVACEGTKKNSKGNPCRICNGTGKKPGSENKEPDKKAGSKAGAASGDDKCPHGHKFGAECEDHNECENCDVWNECMDAKEQEG